MELYIIKWAACLGILFLFYKIFLENTSLHGFKRYYLLGSLIAAFIIPSITFTEYVIVTEPIAPVLASEMNATIIYTSEDQVTNTSYWSTILWSIYALGVLFFGMRFGRNLYGILRKIRRNPKTKELNIFHVLLNIPTTPHTFFSYIFLNRKKYEAREIPEEVMLHERTHAREKHSIDVLLIELIQIVFWFNPFVYGFKHSIKLNHEFLADRAVLNKGVSTVDYQKILLAFSSTAGTPQLANSINYSSNRLNQLFSRIAFGQVKKRFTVMKNQTSSRSIWLRTLILLPLVALLVYGFSSTQIVEKKATDTSEETIKATPNELITYNELAKSYNEEFAKPDSKRIVKLKDLRIMEVIYGKMSNAQKANAQPFPECIPPPPQEDQDKKGSSKAKATPKQIKEYNRIAKKYNEMPRSNMRIDGKEIARMRELYDIMTLDQRKNAEPYPSIPPPPPPPPPVKKKGSEPKIADVPPPPPPPGEPNEFKLKEVPPPPPPPGEPNEFDLQEVPPPPPPPDGKNEFVWADPPPPPPPPPKVDIKEHIQEMIKAGATFYYNGKEVTPNWVQDLVLFNKKLNVQTKEYSSSPPIVYISDDFVFDQEQKINKESNDNRFAAGPQKKPETALDVVNKMIQQNAQFFFKGKKISAEEAKKVAKERNNLTVEIKKKKGENPEVHISDGC